MATAAGQAAPMGEGMVAMVSAAMDLWRDIPDERLKHFVERAMVKAAPYAASIATVAKLYQDRNKDENGHPVHDEVATVRHRQAVEEANPTPRPRLEDHGSRPISTMDRADYLRICASFYTAAGLPVPGHLLSPEASEAGEITPKSPNP